MDIASISKLSVVIDRECLEERASVVFHVGRKDQGESSTMVQDGGHEPVVSNGRRYLGGREMAVEHSRGQKYAISRSFDSVGRVISG